MKRYFFAITFLAMFVYSMPLLAQNATVAPPSYIENKDEIKRQVGRTITVKGKYTPLDIKVPGYARRAKLMLSDNSGIIIDTGNNSKRKKKETKKWKGKEVLISGKVVENARLSDNKALKPLVAALCLKDVKIIGAPPAANGNAQK